MEESLRVVGEYGTYQSHIKIILLSCAFLTNIYSIQIDIMLHFPNFIISQNNITMHNITKVYKIDTKEGTTEDLTYTSEDGEEYLGKKLIIELKFEQNDNYCLFRINDNEIKSIRNLYVGKLYGDQTCYLASFNKINSEFDLAHYIKCGSGSEYAERMSITSNILIFGLM